MKLTTQRSTLRQAKADAVVLFVHEDPSHLQKNLKELRTFFGKKIDSLIALESFKGKENEILSVYTEKKLSSPRLYLVGMGAMKKLSLEQYRRAAASAAKHASSSSVKHLAFMMPTSGSSSTLTTNNVAGAIVEGMMLSQYKFDKYFTEKKNSDKNISEVSLCAAEESIVRNMKRALHDAKIVCEATCLARDLENSPANDLYPETLADSARKSGEKHGFRVVVWDKKRIEQAGFGGLIAVNAGSERPARFIILEHNAGRNNLDTIVLVGKGITFDAGGISIKPAAGMAEMKMDMSGAAAVIGTMEAATRLNLPVHLVGLIPSTENLLGGMAMKPGDIITHYGGKTSEVDNTDAEGRLVLADALAYAAQYKPTAVIDLATLTGACVVALGNHATGMMGNDDDLMAQLKRAGEATYERVWQLPLFEEYEKQIKSDVADVKNVGGRWAGAITAGLFLKKFIGDYKWVHLDIAGTAILEESLPYIPKGGSGVGVRLLIEFLRNWKR
ncbi:MAG: leucyl aminopeptidase [Ignavibacteriae bacterium]|nr:leucyl aminopeptidase [Ignavibacteria bacterium]MBI3365231.1 leucyl aminopeptidase [Ignavibacteriota bacterium]